MMNKNGKAEISGDYQFRAMNSGPQLQRFWHRNKLWVLDQVAPITENHVVVDVGCGSGNLTLHSASKCKLAIGIDPSETAIQFCNSLSSNGHSVFIPAAGDALPFPDEYADVVLLVEVIEHLDAPMKIISEVSRILKKGGLIFVTTPNYAFPSLWPPMEWLADRSRMVAKMGGGEQHVQKFSPPSLADRFQKAGFETVRLGTFYHFSPFASMLFNKWAETLLAKEVKSGDLGGMIIYYLGQKTNDITDL
jgi:2-polyprenyl-3-methyl-5-hydroxy-6-metoxy-1,4-benzoquinol methylase